MRKKHYRPDKQKDVYYEFFNELDSAVVALTGYIEEKPEFNGFARFDILLDGKYASLGGSLPIRCVCGCNAYCLCCSR